MGVIASKMADVASPKICSTGWLGRCMIIGLGLGLVGTGAMQATPEETSVSSQSWESGGIVMGTRIIF